MVNRKLIFITLLFGIFMFSLAGVSAAPPVTTVQQFADGYSITVHPITQQFKVGEDVKFHVHVFNQSNGYPINSSIECFFHMYNNTNHKVTLITSTVDDLFDYEFLVLGGNFTTDVKSYHVFCENGVGGDYEYAIEVNSTGKELNLSEAILYFVMVFGLLVFLMLSLYGGIAIPYRNNYSDDGKLISVNDLRYVKILSLFASYGILTWLANIMVAISNNYIDLGMALGFFTIMFKIMMFALYPVMIFTVIFIVIEMVKGFRTNKLLSRGLL